MTEKKMPLRDRNVLVFEMKDLLSPFKSCVGEAMSLTKSSQLCRHSQHSPPQTHTSTENKTKPVKLMQAYKQPYQITMNLF